MEEVIKITVKAVEDLNQSIKNDLSSKNIDNTGEASASIRIEIDENKQSVKSIGLSYLEFLNTGRGPGKFPPVDEINKWVEQKLGISSAEAQGISYVIGKKIAEQGTEIYRNRQKGIQLEDKVINLRVKLKNELPKYAKADVLNTLKEFTKKKLS